MIIFDTDIISLFAKAAKLDLLNNTFTNHSLCITAKIKEELNIPILYGYLFPETIFSFCKLLIPSEEEYKLFENLSIKYPILGKGGNEAIAIAKIRGAIFATNDKKAFKISNAEGITTINVYTILTFIYQNDILSRNEIEEIIQLFEQTDNIKMQDIDSIFS